MLVDWKVGSKARLRVMLLVVRKEKSKAEWSVERKECLLADLLVEPSGSKKGTQKAETKVTKLETMMVD